MPFSNSSRSLQRPESGKIKLLNRSHSVVVILRIPIRQAAEASAFSCHWSLDSFSTRFLRRMDHIMLRNWNMDKVHEPSWCIASALKATQRASKSSWFRACSSCFLVWHFAEVLDEGCSFSDFVCLLCSALRGGSVRKLGQGQTKSDIASVVSLLMQQPRALQKHARLLGTMRKRILGQSPAVGTGCTMLNTETSHAQQLKRQIYSLWSSILISESLPLVTLA